MNIGHKQRIIADHGFIAGLGSPVDGHIFTDGNIVPDLDDTCPHLQTSGPAEWQI